jgi:predicted nucleic acid-binding protein
MSMERASPVPAGVLATDPVEVPTAGPTGSPASSAEIVTDASVWVSRFIDDDVHHEASVSWLRRQIDAATFLVGPTLLLVEVAAAIARRTGDAALAAAIVEQLEQFPPLRLEPLDDALAAVAVSLAGSLGLRGADAVYVAVARQLGAPLVSWDEEQIRRAGAVRPTDT